jgi:hypothetical protein
MQLALALPTEVAGTARCSRPLCFASGANEAGEIAGFSSIGIPVGVSAAELGPDAIEILRRLAGHDVPVFVDSGAYGEVPRTRAPRHRAGDRQRTEGREISHAEWERRLALYSVLAQMLGRTLSAVTPDRVGDQDITLRRLVVYSPAVRRVAAFGPSLLLPLHRGRLSLTDFHAAAEDVLGLPLIPSFPMLKSRTTAAELLRAIDILRPTRIHFLGLGPRSARARDLLRILAMRAPALRVSMDANLVVAAVGRRPDGSAARPLTRVQDAVRARGFPDAHGTVVELGWGIRTDFTDSVSFPSEWMGPAALRTAATRAALPGEHTSRWLKDPDRFLQDPVHADDQDGPAWWEHPSMAHALEDAWREYLNRRHTAPRKAEAIRRAFRGHPAAGQFIPPPGIRSLVNDAGKSGAREQSQGSDRAAA